MASGDGRLRAAETPVDYAAFGAPLVDCPADIAGQLVFMELPLDERRQGD
jgi:hypothetical protein